MQPTLLQATPSRNWQKLKQIIHILHPRYPPKIIERTLKSKQKNKCVCIHKVIRLIIKKMEKEKKSRSHRCDLNRPRSRHGHKYSKYKKCFIMIMVICMYKAISKQHLKLNS